MSERWNRQAWGRTHSQPQSYRAYYQSCIACGGRAANFHHILPQQWLKREAGPGLKDFLRDRRNLVPMCFECHMNHENWSKRLTRDQVPESAWEFARLFGERGVCALERYYPEKAA